MCLNTCNISPPLATSVLALHRHLSSPMLKQPPGEHERDGSMNGAVYIYIYFIYLFMYLFIYIHIYLYIFISIYLGKFVGPPSPASGCVGSSGGFKSFSVASLCAGTTSRVGASAQQQHHLRLQGRWLHTPCTPPWRGCRLGSEGRSLTISSMRRHWNLLLLWLRISWLEGHLTLSQRRTLDSRSTWAKLFTQALRKLMAIYVGTRVYITNKTARFKRLQDSIGLLSGAFAEFTCIYSIYTCSSGAHSYAHILIDIFAFLHVYRSI